ncbi:ABC transporter ATP-binding protein [Rhodophyticola porphyridii]|uniref:ABC transporter ATP-binding protein n=1 Tax=Rhodophyticola porphyridii TaxID=1852017 RepID=A0A3L9Y1Z1_9RHOB|nr:ABC transporter ATP-binding protein [Rhodophyticola porphyridii]RMA42849.1 ABC transporter ATP-binding protein [Rhodophyticola porphyridii]
MLSVTDIHKSFETEDGPLPVLRGVSLTVAPGDTLALTGESGSGKSTLLHLIGGLDTADKGRIEVDDVDLSALDDAGRARLRRDMVGLIFQQFNLIPSLTVAQNLSFQARLAGRHDAAWVDELARRLGLSEHLARYPEQLSGGQQQRVAIGRTLAARPRVVLADEPTGNLDETTGDTVLGLLLELAAETGTAILMVTHSTRLAHRLARQVHLTKGRLGSAGLGRAAE